MVTWRRHGWGRAAALCVAVAVALVAFNGLLVDRLRLRPVRGAERDRERLLARDRDDPAVRVLGVRLAGGVDRDARAAGRVARAAGADATVTTRRSRSGALVLVASVIGFTKAETERVWLPFVPLACVAAAAALAALPVARLRLVLASLAVQALAIELLFFTVW